MYVETLKTKSSDEQLNNIESTKLILCFIFKKSAMVNVYE